MSTKKISMDPYLMEVYKHYISIKDGDFKKSQEVFRCVFDQVKNKMKEKCNYFSKYSSQVMYAGSVYDDIKVSRLDEFDMDIVIRLPLSYDNDIIIENDKAGYVKLIIKDGFDNLDKQPNWEQCHKVTRDWRDSDKYLLQNKFRHWLHGIVEKAVKDLKEKVEVNGCNYRLTYKESGPAFTLKLKNVEGEEDFTLDVDLVPVIKFMSPRWPEGYRNEGSQVKDWLVVPKPNKDIKDDTLRNRCWRLSFQEFEREMIKGSQQLKPTIRLVKKLRDTLEMKAIASYYIKTLFMWKVHKTSKDEKPFWQNKISTLFCIMVEELYEAIKVKKIPYFWHEDYNLIGGLKPTLQKVYFDKLKDVLESLKSNNVDKVMASLLTTNELQQFRDSEFYKKHPPNPVTPNNSIVVQPQKLVQRKPSIDMDFLYTKVCDLENEVENLKEQIKKMQLEKSIADNKHSQVEENILQQADNKNMVVCACNLNYDKVPIDDLLQ